VINATIVRNSSGSVIGFTVKNHGKSIACAAVSMLVLNTVNSIELLTEDKFLCDYKKKGGYLKFTLSDSVKRSEGTDALLDALVLGLKTAKIEHPTEIKITERRL